MLDKKLFSKDWVYENVFGLSPDQYNEEKDTLFEDAMNSFRISQIENEGNDPSESGMSYGTPHDLASLYGNKRDKSVGPAQVPTGYDEKPPGRPVEDPTKYGSQHSNYGKDPLGKKNPELTMSEITKPSRIPSHEAQSLKKSLQKMKINKQILNEKDENGMLNENNIKPQE